MQAEHLCTGLSLWKDTNMEVVLCRVWRGKNTQEP